MLTETQFTFGSLSAFVGTMAVLAVVPGPSDLIVVARSISSGLVQGLLTVLGIITGDLIFIAVAVLGLSAFAESASGGFAVLKILGAVYLGWLGATSCLAASRPSTPDHDHNSILETPSPKASGFISGLLITLADPKAILFYAGLLPGYLDLAQVTAIDTGIVAGAAILIVGLVKGTYAFLAERSRHLLTNPKANQTLQLLAGLTLIGTAIWLCFAT